MKAAIPTLFALLALAASRGMADDMVVAAATATSQKASPSLSTQVPVEAKKDTAAAKADAARKKNLEGIRKRQDAEDAVNKAIAESLRAKAKRYYREEKARKTGGAPAETTQSSGGDSSKKNTD